MKTLFFVFIPDFVKFRDEDHCFLVHTVRFEVLNFLCLPPLKICLCSPTPPLPSHAIPGAGPDLLIAKRFFAIFPKMLAFSGQMICWLSGHRPQYSSCTTRRTVDTSMHNKINFATAMKSNTENQTYSALKIELRNRTR